MYPHACPVKALGWILRKWLDVFYLVQYTL